MLSLKLWHYYHKNASNKKKKKKKELDTPRYCVACGRVDDRLPIVHLEWCTQSVPVHNWEANVRKGKLTRVCVSACSPKKDGPTIFNENGRDAAVHFGVMMQRRQSMTRNAKHAKQNSLNDVNPLYIFLFFFQKFWNNWKFGEGGKKNCLRALGGFKYLRGKKKKNPFWKKKKKTAHQKGTGVRSESNVPDIVLLLFFFTLEWCKKATDGCPIVSSIRPCYVLI